MAITDTDTNEFLHRASCPDAIAIIEAVSAGRDLPGVQSEADPGGLHVSWPEVDQSWLSTTEQGAMRLARIVAEMERHGGHFPGAIGGTIEVAVLHLTRGTR